MLVFTYTIPDCRRAKLKGWYIATFFVAIAWMGLLVELMVEHSIEAFHEALGIDMGPLGLTFVAGGTSFPDFLASMLVAKKGLADMAVSNAFGSNIFDVLLGLGWPWMMQTTIVDPGGTCTVRAVRRCLEPCAKTWSRGCCSGAVHRLNELPQQLLRAARRQLLHLALRPLLRQVESCPAHGRDYVRALRLVLRAVSQKSGGLTRVWLAGRRVVSYFMWAGSLFM